MKLFDDQAFGVVTLWQEARNQPHEGRVAVAEVIRNRMKSGPFSDGTVVGTCLAPYQFSGWNPKDANRIPSLKLDTKDPIVADCQVAWNIAQAGSNLAHGADHYLNLKTVPKIPDWYDEAKVVAVIGDHTFLRLGK